MVIALAGRRVDEPKAESPRFPLRNTTLVEDRLRALFVEKKATALVCSGACGADLLALKVAGDLSMIRKLVLPFGPEKFIPQSVTDRPGDWESCFHAVYDELRGQGRVTILGNATDDETAYRKTNLEILNQAEEIRRESGVPGGKGSDVKATGGVEVVIVWEGAPTGVGDMTLNFKREGERRGYGICEIMTL